MRLNPIDDALFIKMAEKLDFCQEILRVFLGDNQLIVLENVPQNIVKNLQGRSCILDLTSNACFPYWNLGNIRSYRLEKVAPFGI